MKSYYLVQAEGPLRLHRMAKAAQIKIAAPAVHRMWCYDPLRRVSVVVYKRDRLLGADRPADGVKSRRHRFHLLEPLLAQIGEIEDLACPGRSARVRHSGIMTSRRASRSLT